MEPFYSEKFGDKQQTPARKCKSSKSQPATLADLCSCESTASSYVCLDCHRKGRRKDLEGMRLPKIESGGFIHKKKKRKKMKGRLDLISHQYERTTTSIFDFSKEKVSPFRFPFGIDKNSTILPSFVNFNSTLRSILGLKNYGKIKYKASSTIDNPGTKDCNSSVSSASSSNEKLEQEDSCQDEQEKTIDREKLLKENELVNEVVRRCLWHISSTISPDDVTLWSNANKMAEDISKLIVRAQDKGADISTQTLENEKREINLAYDCEAVKPPFLTEPGPFYQVLVTEKSDQKPSKTPTPSKSGRTLCLCENEQNILKGRSGAAAKYKLLVDQLVELLEGLHNDQAFCECENESETRAINETAHGDSSKITEEQESEGNLSKKSGKSRELRTESQKKLKEDHLSKSVIIITNSEMNKPEPRDLTEKCGNDCFLKELFEMYVKNQGQ